MSSRHDSYHSSREKGKYDEEEGEEAEAEEEVQGIFVRALFGFRTEEESSLTFEAGDVIEILGQLECTFSLSLAGEIREEARGRTGA
jgi:hypothetical protein